MYPKPGAAENERMQGRKERSELEGGERMENCKAAWEFVNPVDKSEGFHLAHWVSLMCYCAPVTGLFFN